MKKFIAVLILMIILFSFPLNIAKAESLNNVVPTYTWDCGNPLVNEEMNKEIDDYKENDANMAEKFLASQVQNIMNIGSVAGLNTLVYGNPYCVWMDKQDSLSKDGIFTVTEREKIVDPMLKMFSAIYVSLLTLAILISALKMGFGAMNPQAKAEFWQDSRMWIVSGLLMALYIPVTNIIFGMNTAVVQSIRNVLISNGVGVDGVSIIAGWKDMITIMPVMSLLITFLGEWLLAVILNFIYIARKIIILVLLVLGPIGAYSLLFNRTRAFFGVWLKEMVGNVFLQSIHGIVLFAFAMLSSLGAGVLMKLGLMMMFIPVSGMISRWLNIGDSSSKMGQMMTMAGAGGILSTIMVAQHAGSILRGGNIANNNSNGGTTMNSAENALINAGGGSDSNITKISNMATGDNSAKWQSVKKGAGALGAFVGGAAGMVTMNPMIAAATAKAGQSIATGTAQFGRNVIAGGTNMIQTGKNALNYAGPMGTGLKGLSKDLSARREFFGDMGESVGSLVGLGQAGRKLGHGLSGVSRTRLADTPFHQGGMSFTGPNGEAQPVTWNTLSKVNPGAEVMHLQTNKGSSFWMKNQDGGWTSVGLKGQADPTLKNGHVRSTSFKLGNPVQGGLELQPNGAYRQRLDTQNQGMIQMGAGSEPQGNSSSIVGLPGSTPHLMRTGNSYIVGGGNANGQINQTSINAALTSERFSDTNYDASKINPDSYVAFTSLNHKANTGSDHMADLVYSGQKGMKNATGWVASKVRNNKTSRNREVI
ncbi:hypothetical protein [Bacillus sp. FJAT-29937]|uniref:hypothetical protein n=1 Tax=Bacillus sp. FJAT-29937 TaxID=1720553 RepID=UPI0008340CB1|nr:hypothetical protein [Bacillus sp. FJAT-29937]